MAVHPFPGLIAVPVPHCRVPARRKGDSPSPSQPAGTVPLFAFPPSRRPAVRRSGSPAVSIVKTLLLFLAGMAVLRLQFLLFGDVVGVDPVFLSGFYAAIVVPAPACLWLAAFMGLAGDWMVGYPMGMQGLALVGVAGLCATTVRAEVSPHPRLLLTAADVPRLRHACGVGVPLAPTAAGAAASQPGSGAAATQPAAGPFGSCGVEYKALRAALERHVVGTTLPGELLAAGFLHVAEPEHKGDAACVRIVLDALRHPDWLTTDPLEYAIALDWCWDALDPTERRAFLIAAIDRVEPLRPTDNPLDAQRFRNGLFALALAVAVEPGDEPSATWATVRRKLAEAART